MNLYLVRHGKAAHMIVHPDQPLTDLGKEDVLKVAQYLKKSGVSVGKVWHSTKTRAAQTAQLIAEALQYQGGFETREDLNPHDPVESVAKDIQLFRDQKNESNLMIVGHLPYLSHLASFLLKNPTVSKQLEFKQSSVVCLTPQESNLWHLNWTVEPGSIQDTPNES